MISALTTLCIIGVALPEPPDNRRWWRMRIGEHAGSGHMTPCGRRLHRKAWRIKRPRDGSHKTRAA